MKKLNLLLLLAFFAGVLQCFAIDWSGIGFLGDGAGGGLYANQYKISVPSGIDVVNIQHPGFATADGIYITFPSADYTNNITIGGEKASYNVQGAGIILHLSNFTAQETEVTVNYSGGSKTFYVYYINGSSKTPSDLVVNKTSYEIQKKGSVTILKNSGTLHYTTSSSGAVSFSSSNSSVATVNPTTGKVDAVAAGTAVITINQAADNTYAAGSKQITITVVKDPSEIEWSEYLEYVAGCEAYKDKIKIEKVDNLTIINIQYHDLKEGAYVEITANVGNIQDCSLPEGSYATQGLGIWIYLSSLTQKITSVTLTGTNGSVTFRIYNEDGADTPDCGTCFPVNF